ncbi:MAG: hypothetical protein JO020_01665 [Chloroflexi bacterium]|nr:hypothetical protein [Chloroflexota bacterium]MBV9892857.1 hypothetical protein [Chloroflexota bacterium]
MKWLGRLTVLFVTLLLVYGSLSAALPAGAQSLQPQPCPALQLDNPNPGDTLMPGTVVISGIAFDPAATVGSGVSRVDFFLGERDAGGLYLGSATSIPNADSFGPPRFQTSLTIPKVMLASAEFVVYAFASVGPGQTTVVVPVRVGDIPPPKSGGPSPPTPAAVARVSSNCGAVATPVNLAPPLPAEIAFTPTPGPQLFGTPGPPGAPLIDNPGAILDLSNPSPGDLLPLGGYVVSGIAYDPASSSGPGVDRIQFYLDPRENGGWFVGSAVPAAAAPGQAPRFSATLFIPNSAQKGSHVFTAYARSSVIGAETVASVPVFVGEKPTPTPLPS